MPEQQIHALAVRRDDVPAGGTATAVYDHLCGRWREDATQNGLTLVDGAEITARENPDDGTILVEGRVVPLGVEAANRVAHGGTPVLRVPDSQMSPEEAAAADDAAAHRPVGANVVPSATAETEKVPLLKPTGRERSRTTHIQAMLRNALALAAACENAGQWVEVEVGGVVGLRRVPTIDALEVAADDALHAAAELRAERRSLNGWPQT